MIRILLLWVAGPIIYTTRNAGLTLENDGNSADHMLSMEHLPGVEVSFTEAHQELNRIQQSREFRASKRCFDFLHYIVTRTLSGEEETLKERTIGMELFGRPASYEPSDDATVRVKAGQVRKRLHDYYASEGLADPVRIELPSGSYVPLFRYPDRVLGVASPLERSLIDAPVCAALEDQPRAPLHWAALLHRWKWLLASLIVVLTLCLIYLGIFQRRNASSPLVEQFWAPLVRSENPVWLCVSTVPVFTQKRDPPNSFEDIVSTRDQFLAIGDLNAVTRISEMLVQRKHPYRLRVGTELSYRDLQTAPAILVGYSYSRWNEISRQLRFSLINNAVLDNGHPSQWKISSYPADPQLTQDYALISRFFDPDSHSVLVEIAGISYFGTEAAGNVVSNPAQFSEILRGLPAGWQNKNVQIVLRVNIVHGSPGIPVAVASHVW